MGEGKKGVPGFVWVLGALLFMGGISVITSAGDGLASAASMLIVGSIGAWMFFSK